MLQKENQMLLTVVLIVISIFFPPAWFSVIAYVLYLVLTKKKRRDKVLMRAIRKLINAGEEQAILKHVYYSAAKSFAADHGASMSPYKNDSEDDCLIFDINMNGNSYSVCVQRWMKDETMLTVKTDADARDDFANLVGPDLAAILKQ
jgi:hypothetical protein